MSVTSIHLLFVNYFFLFFSAYRLVEVTAEVMVRKRHRPIGTGAPTAGECTDNSHHCVDTGVTFTPGHWHVRSVGQFLNSPSTILLQPKKRKTSSNNEHFQNSSLRIGALVK